MAVRSKKEDQTARNQPGRAGVTMKDLDRSSHRQPDATSFARYLLSQSTMSSEGGASGKVCVLLRRVEISTQIMQMASSKSL